MQWLESGLVSLRSDVVLLLRFGRTVYKHEAVGYCGRDRLESDDAALHELGLESSFQHDDLIALAAQLNSGGQTVEGEEIETPGKFFTFARRRLDLLAKWGGAEPSERNKTREFGYGIGHRDSKPPETLTTNGSRLKAVRQKWARPRLASTENRLRDPMFHRRAILIRHRFSIFGVISGMALVAGCATGVEQRGNLPSQDKIAEVHPGSTTKDEVIKILGSPSSVGIFNDKCWYYISRRTGQIAFFDPNVLDQQVYIVNFDDQGVVTAVDHKGLEDGKEIIPVARATPAPGRELSFLEQVIGNLGKFNSGAGGKGGGGGTGNTHQTGRPDN
jgi:outer membrane protein assembly factor BamE (lipoprotein component of BamABCDE complex)